MIEGSAVPEPDTNPDPYLWLMDPDPDPGGPKTVDPDPQHCSYEYTSSKICHYVHTGLCLYMENSGIVGVLTCKFVYSICM
jgi:hypothetical protein